MCLVADLTNVHGDLLANKNTKFNKAVSQHQQFCTIKQMFTVIFPISQWMHKYKRKPKTTHINKQNAQTGQPLVKEPASICK